MKKLQIVTGGCGFIGQHVVCALLKCTNNKILVIDNKITGDKIINDTRVDYIFEDICNKDIFKYIDMYYSDYVITDIWNFACPASPKKYRQHALHVIDTCTIGVKNICELVLKYDARLIHASTSEIYGDSSELMDESKNMGNVNTFGPRSCYDEGKRIAETIIYEYNLPKFFIFRLFNTFGPGMKWDDGRVIPNFIVSALFNKPLKIYGTNTSRTFCFITELINKLMYITTNVKSINEPVNLGNDKNIYDILTIAEKIITMTNSSSKIKYVDGLLDDPRSRYPILHKINSICDLQYIRNVSIDEGLKHTIEYFEELIENNGLPLHHVHESNFLSYHKTN